jgi:hypothetical protein
VEKGCFVVLLIITASLSLYSDRRSVNTAVPGPGRRDLGGSIRRKLSFATQISSRRHVRYSAERVQRQEVVVAAHQDMRLAIERYLQELIVVERDGNTAGSALSYKC